MVTTAERGSSSDRHAWCGCLSNEATVALWDTIRPFLLAFKHDLTEFAEPDDILKQVLKTNLDLWMVISETGQLDGIILAYMERHKTRASYVLRWAAGRGLWKYRNKLTSAIEEFALGAGATHINVIGRKGWTKVLASKKFKSIAIVLEKDLRKTRMN